MNLKSISIVFFSFRVKDIHSTHMATVCFVHILYQSLPLPEMLQEVRSLVFFAVWLLLFESQHFLFE